MIEKALLIYLQSNTALVAKAGGASHICVVQAPTKVTMPYIIIEPTGGSRDNITAGKVEERNSVRIKVDVPADKMIYGRELIEMAKALVENYRGDIEGVTDLHISSSAISDFPGLAGVYRYQFSALCRWVETRKKPTRYDPS